MTATDRDDPAQRRSADLRVVLDYHARTKHGLQRYARSLGYLDWANQPDPFRRYAGAPIVELECVDPAPSEASADRASADRASAEPVSPRYDDLFVPGAVPPRLLARAAIAQLLYDSLALSAWKVAGSARWSLRVNPSSGNLHPTEGYLVLPPLPDLADHAVVWHYAPHEHGLERRLALAPDEWQALAAQLPAGALLVGLTSIWWREAWKYGERAFRYCQHDAGHAIAAVALAAAAQGWEARVLGVLADRDVDALLGVHAQQGIEAEHAECLLAVHPHGAAWPAAPAAFTLPADLLARLRSAAWRGVPSRLSQEHHPWPVIDAVAEASAHPGGGASEVPPPSTPPSPPSSTSPRAIDARRILRQRRSAVDMDGHTPLAKDAFFAMLQRVCAGQPPFTTLPWAPCVDLVLFVHRVTGLPPGLYLLLRAPERRAELQAAMRAEFLWRVADGCPHDLPLWLLLEGDARPLARAASCHQDIAADGAFAAAMLARFEPELRARGPSFYRRLHHEAGAIGQVLYVEAEAAGVRSTGIGCFFDDVTHDALGLGGRTFQVLYHFTVGGPVEDPRLRTEPAYAHRGR